MLVFSEDPKRAEHEMHAVIFYLVTFGYIDGDFDAKERAYVQSHIEKLVRHRAALLMRDADTAARAETIERCIKHFHEVFEGVDANVRELFTESVTDAEDPREFVRSKLKVRCFEIFQSFDRQGQDHLMTAVDGLLMADGEAHPAEVEFRAELAALFEQELDVELSPDTEFDSKSRLEVAAPFRAQPIPIDHPFFRPYEQAFDGDPTKVKKQVNVDVDLLEAAERVLSAQRARGAGLLDGKTNIAQLKGVVGKLDGHTYVYMPPPEQAFELTVLGDLHGCYSVLKSTLVHSRFLEKVTAYRANPGRVPYPLLVLLGDYIDRGRFGLNGVLRTVLQLFVAAPEHVIVLRGNHEYYIEHKGRVFGGVKPSETIDELKPLVDIDVLHAYRLFFEKLPNVLLFDEMMFVHGGAPRDRTLKTKWKDLSSLNDPDLRFEMMWSDPSEADIIPMELQDKVARFSFGRLQFKAFMRRLGATTMVRGHEKILCGFQRTYNDDDAKLFTLFSSGGLHNNDLPEESAYRQVTPMAMTVQFGPDGCRMVPWAPDYQSFNDPIRNAFFDSSPRLPTAG